MFVCVCVSCLAAEPELKAAVGDTVFKIGKNTCMKNQWLAFDKASKLYVRKVGALCVCVRERRRERKRE